MALILIISVERLALQVTLEEWLDAVVMGFVRTLYSDQEANSSSVLHSFRRRLCNHLYETYTRARIEQLGCIRKSSCDLQL